MKKIVWLLSLFFVALSLTTSAQMRAPQGTQYNKALNGNALDAVRQRYAQNANRQANTDIFIDYGASSGDNATLNAAFINMHFAQNDSFGDRYVVVAFDSLHDNTSDTGYKYSDFDSVRVDSLFIPFGHENNDGLSDTVIVKLVQLNA